MNKKRMRECSQHLLSIDQGTETSSFCLYGYFSKKPVMSFFSIDSNQSKGEIIYLIHSLFVDIFLVYIALVILLLIYIALKRLTDAFYKGISDN